MDRVERDWWERASYETECSSEIQRKGWILENREKREECFVDMVSSVKLHMPAGDVQ